MYTQQLHNLLRSRMIACYKHFGNNTFIILHLLLLVLFQWNFICVFTQENDLPQNYMEIGFRFDSDVLLWSETRSTIVTEMPTMHKLIFTNVMNTENITAYGYDLFDVRYFCYYCTKLLLLYEIFYY